MVGDEVDGDCDGLEECFVDNDGDGYADPTVTVASADTDCDDDGEADAAMARTDCDDRTAMVSPDADEVCDDANVDENCNGAADDADSTTLVSSKTTYYPDVDRDGYGDRANAGLQACDDLSTMATSYVVDNTDCDDSTMSTYPGAPETTGDGVDSDCDGGEICFQDTDDDGYVDATKTVVSADADCDDATEGRASDPTGDYNDTDDTINPGATEICDGANTDEDCDGLADDLDASVDATTKTRFYRDGDRDGYGSRLDTGTLYCDDPSTSTRNATDTPIVMIRKQRRILAQKSPLAMKSTRTVTVAKSALRTQTMMGTERVRERLCRRMRTAPIPQKPQRRIRPVIVMTPTTPSIPVLSRCAMAESTTIAVFQQRKTA